MNFRTATRQQLEAIVFHDSDCPIDLWLQAAEEYARRHQSRMDRMRAMMQARAKRHVAH